VDKGLTRNVVNVHCPVNIRMTSRVSLVLYSRRPITCICMISSVNFGIAIEL